MKITESRRTVEWDWTVTRLGRRLHAPVEWNDPHYDVTDPDGLTACGYRGHLFIPGLFSRLGTPRCALCCDVLGWPHGVGSPKNDEALRPLVDARLAALEAAP